MDERRTIVLAICFIFRIGFATMITPKDTISWVSFVAVYGVSIISLEQLNDIYRFLDLILMNERDFELFTECTPRNAPVMIN